MKYRNDAGQSHYLAWALFPRESLANSCWLRRRSLRRRVIAGCSSEVTGTIGVTSARQFTIEGHVNTSHGRVSTSISQQQNFSSTQTIDFDTANFTVLNQKGSVENSVLSATTVHNNKGITVTRENFSFPITVNVKFPVADSTFGFTVETTQKYMLSKEVWHNGSLIDFSAVTNSAHSSDVSLASSQKYTSVSSDSASYACEVTSKNNVLTSVSAGCGH